MSTATGTARPKTGRCYWDADRWLKYGERLHRVIGHIDHVLRRLPPTPGWKARDTDALLKVEHLVELALVNMERVIDEHFGGRWSNVPAPIDEFPQHWFERRPVESRPWTRRPEPTSREDWILFGGMIKESRETLQGCLCEFSNECRGRDRHFHLTSLTRAIARIDRVKCRLDSMVCEQHPSWDEATRVFHGPQSVEAS
jgi:hypothetical protein